MYGCQAKIAALNYGLIAGPARNICPLSLSNALKPSEGFLGGAFMILMMHGQLARILSGEFTTASGLEAERRFWGLRKESKKGQYMLLN